MTARKRPEISAILITQNEAHNLRDCLTSVSWVDEIIIVDAGSADGTLDIAREYTEKIYQNPWPGFAAQKQFGLDRATKPWALSIDADERVTPELRNEIVALLSSSEIPHSGYAIPRLSTFLGKFIYHCGWYPGYQLRLFRREVTRLSPARVHEGFLVDGSVDNLKNHFLHYTHPTLAESLKRLNRYSSLEAADRVARKRVHWWDMIAHPVAAFFNKYIGLRGYKDGMHGFLLSAVTAMVKMALYMKIWEMQNTHSSTTPPAQVGTH